MNSDKNVLTRRDAIKLGSMALGGVALTSTLTACSTSAEERISEANKELINNLDPSQTTLPIGSVVELEAGRFMVVGLRSLDRKTVSENLYVYDYLGLAWPEGCMYPYGISSYVYEFNRGDIHQVLSLGPINDEERDFRQYMEQWDNSTLTGPWEEGTEPKYIYDSAAGPESEQKYRLQGKLSEDLYGEHGNEFHGGLCYSVSDDESSENE